ncbi:MAG: hypothetical protein ACSHX8_07410 [Opitutaceae bacterium]
MKSIILSTLLSVGLVSFVSAAKSFHEDFSGGDFGPNLSQSGGSGMPAIIDGKLVFSGTGDDGRSWVATNDADYASVSFNARVTIQIEDADEKNEFTHFIGLGVGDDHDRDGEGPIFDEPAVGPTAYFGVRGIDNVIVGDVTNRKAKRTVGEEFSGLDLEVGTYTLNLLYDHLGQTLSLLVNGESFGTVIDTSDNNFDNSNARIFIGSSENNTFDDYYVAIPESNTFVLIGGLFALSYVVNRRRR